jgi:hypothetical protein
MRRQRYSDRTLLILTYRDGAMPTSGTFSEISDIVADITLRGHVCKIDIFTWNEAESRWMIYHRDPAWVEDQFRRKL